METTTSLRERALSGERLCGVLVRMPSDELVEMAAVAGADFVVVDCEHGPADVVALRHHIAAAQLHGVAVIVRVGSDEPALILRALDHGAAGIIAPHVDDAAGARALVDAVHYPPLGHRGFATYGRAGRYGTVPGPEHRQRMSEQTLVIGMIESPAGAAAVDGITGVAGLDAIMIGTADLGASSGPTDLPAAESVARVNAALARSSTLRMDIVTDAAAASAAYDDGATLVVYNLTAAVMALFEGLFAVRR